MTQDWISFADRDRLLETSDGTVVNHLVLPSGVDLDRILVNPMRIDRLGRLAGAKQVHLVMHDSNEGGEGFSFDAEMQADGSAILSKMKHKRKSKRSALVTYDDSDHPLSDKIETLNHAIRQREEQDEEKEETDLNPYIEMMYGSYKANALGLYLPKSAIEKKVEEKGHDGRGKLDEKAWSSVLDHAVRNGLSTAAKVRFASGSEPYIIFNEFFWKGMTGMLLLEGKVIIPGAILSYSTLRRIAQTYRVTSGQVPLEDFNPSIMLNYRVDRYAATVTTAKIGGRVMRYLR